MSRKSRRLLIIAGTVSVLWIATYLINNVIEIPIDTTNGIILEESLWRPNSVEEFSLSYRIDEQRKWIREFSLGPLFKARKAKRILITGKWEHYYGANNFIRCSYAPDLNSKCNFVRDRAFYPFLQEMEHFDAIVGTRNWEFRLYENLSPKSMQQFLFVLEPPYVAIPIDLSRNNAILASYSRKSDITMPYYRWESHSKSLYENSSLSKNYAENKTKLAAVVISNCKDFNGRIKYVRELQKYIAVDFYGKCGDLQCPSDCFRFLGNQYKFYLAFENSNCRDYITEKFFHNALMNNMVPVSLGAHPEDYRSLSPPTSYIHVENFSSPKDLGSYLEKVDKDDELYNKYFLWKDTGYIHNDSAGDFFCRVCGMLFYSDFQQPPKWKKSTQWKDANECLEPHQWYWSRKEN